MKKILATLLVATMLLSCMAVVSFAASSSVYTIEEFGLADFTVEEYETTNEDGDPVTSTRFKDLFTREYTTQAPSGTAIRTTLNNIRKGTATGADLDLTVKTGDVVGIPVYADGLGTTDGQFDLKFDTSKFSLKKASFPSVQSTTQSYGVRVAWSNGSAAKKGFVGAVYLNVLADGIENEDIVISFDASKGDCFNAPDLTKCDAGVLTMTVNPKAVVVEKEEAKVENLTAAVEFTGEVSAESFAQIPAEQITSGDGVVYNYNTHGDYRIFFGKFVADTYKQPTAQGFIIKGGKADVKAAAKTEFKAGEPFGILVFGMGSQTELTAEPFIEY